MKQLLNMKRERQIMLARWVLADNLGILCVYLVAHLLSGSVRTAETAVNGAFVFVAVLVVSVFLLWARGLYAIQAKYLNLRDILQIYAIGAVAALLMALLTVRAGQPIVPQLVAPALFCFAFAPTLLALRISYQRAERRGQTSEEIGEAVRTRTILLGGGDAGEMVVRELKRMAFPSIHLVGIVDDDPRKSYTCIHGVPVIGATSELNSLVEKFHVDDILIAVPSADGETMRHLIALCSATGAKVRTLPALREMIDGGAVSNQIREIDISDLLRRPTIPADAAVTERLVRDEVILITGAGGSIGSELARQVARLSPAKLI
ncbi:hypothetical protein EON82_05665, partial [bacterium]